MTVVKTLLTEPVALGPLCNLYPVFSLGVKGPERSFDYPPPSSAEVKLKTYT